MRLFPSLAVFACFCLLPGANPAGADPVVRSGDAVSLPLQDSLILHADSVRRQWQPLATAEPPVLRTVQNQSKMQLTMDNQGNFGLGEFFLIPFGRGIEVRDPYTREKVIGLMYPREARTRFMLQGSFLFGGVIGTDTLVTHAMWETTPDVEKGGAFTYRSRNPVDSRYDPTAVSDLDITAVYTDTFPAFSASPWYDARPHQPLGIKVTQVSHAWNTPNTDDLIMVDLTIENIGGKTIRSAFVGFYAHGSVTTHNAGGFDSTLLKADDVVGYLQTWEYADQCKADTIRTMYSIDADGDPLGSSWYPNSARSGIGLRYVSKPSERSYVSFNWWADNYNPRLNQATSPNYRPQLLPYGGFSSNDLQAYHYLGNRETDFDQITSWLNRTASGWDPPPQNPATVATDARPFYLYSIGPFDLRPNATTTLTLAFVGAPDVHVNPWDFRSLFGYSKPDVYVDALDFSGLANHARFAAWVYDTPGIDTDNDGYRGAFQICGGDTVWTSGDGKVDYRTDGPPQRPVIRVVPREGNLVVRWNGFYAETSPDPLLGIVDFEGYRVYGGLDERETSFGVLSSYDRENFNRFRFGLSSTGQEIWEQVGLPVSLDSLRIEFGDPDFDPFRYTRARPLKVGDDYFYFGPQDFNVSDLTTPEGIHKVFPEAVDPGTDPSKWTEDDVLYDYGVPLPRFYEYEYIVDDLLPTLPYTISVTSFDFGSPNAGAEALETRPVDNFITAYPQTSSDSVIANKLDVFAYPNPYRADQGYEDFGYENRDGDLPPDRAGRIHFSNLPHQCRIRIYTLDGDLVREINHDVPLGDPTAMDDEWDLITRNRQLAVSGIYYYTVESAERTQIGKLVLIF